MAKAIRFADDTYFDTSGIRHDLIYLSFSGDEWSWTTERQWIPVGFTKIQSNIGNKLTASFPYVTIGEGVSLVRIYGKLTYYQCPEDDYMFIGIAINDVIKVKTITKTALWGNIDIDATLTVNSGEKVSLVVYKSNASKYTLHNFPSFTSTPANYLLIEVVK